MNATEVIEAARFAVNNPDILHTPAQHREIILSLLELMQVESKKENNAAQTENWCWWYDGDERFQLCNSEAEAHSEAQRSIDDGSLAGGEVTYNIGKPCHPIDTIMGDGRLHWAGESIFKQIDEWCGEETGADDRTMDITKEDMGDLGKLALDFLRRRAKVQWWGISKGHTTHTYIAGSNDAAMPEQKGGAV